MPDRFVVSALGVAIEVDLAGVDPAAQDRLLLEWSDSILPSGISPAVTVVATRCGAGLLDALQMVVTRAALNFWRGERWLLHAASIADSRGGVVVLCAADPDETALVLGALGGPYSHVSDEVLAIDRHGAVSGLRNPRPSQETQTPLPREETRWKAESSTVMPYGLRLSRVVFLERSAEELHAPVTELVGQWEALEFLVGASSNLGDFPAPLRTIDALLAATGGVVRVRYSDVASLPLIIDALSDYGLMTEAPSVASSGRRSMVNRQDTTSGPRMYRGAAADSLPLLDGDLAVLESAGDRSILRILSGVERALWEAAEGEKIEDLLGVAAARTNRDDFATVERLAEAAIERMTSLGLLVTEPAWRIAEGVAWVSTTTRATILDVSAGEPRPLVLEASAHAIWTTLSEEGVVPHSVLLRRIALQYELAPEHIEPDVSILLHDLWRRGIVSRV